MSIQKLVTEPLVISREEAKNLYELDSKETMESDSFNIFENYYVRKNKDLLTHVQYFTECYQKQQQCPNLNCFAIKLELSSNEVLEVVACRSKKKDARNLAAFKMLNKINDTIPNFFKAQNLIGLPNFRGSCFMITILLQFFWSNRITTSLMNFKLKNESFKGKLLSALIKLLDVYIKAARKESLEMLNCPTNLHLKYQRPIIEKVKDNPRRPGFKVEVELDASMMAILKILAVEKNFPIYETPGGLYISFYDDLLNSIDKECIEQSVHNPLDPLFSIKFELKSDIEQKKVNFIEVKTKYIGIDSLQELIDSSTVIKDFDRFVNLPKILTFFVSDSLAGFWSEEGNLKIDTQLSVGSSNFDLVGLVIGFEAYKNAEGEILYRHVEYKRGFTVAGYHAISLIKTEDGFLEINNHEILKPTREYNVLRPQMMLFYEVSDYI